MEDICSTFRDIMDWQSSDSEVSDTEQDFQCGLFISKEEADKNYEIAGSLVDDPADEISLAHHSHLLNDDVHLLILEVLEETKIQFKLADFQMLSLHVLGSCNNLVLISPTGSGKMLGMSPPRQIKMLIWRRH